MKHTQRKKKNVLIIIIIIIIARIRLLNISCMVQEGRSAVTNTVTASDVVTQLAYAARSGINLKAASTEGAHTTL